MSDKDNKKTTEGVETPSVNTIQVEMIERSMYDELAAKTAKEIEELQEVIAEEIKQKAELEVKLAEEKEYSKQLEETYSEQLQNTSSGEHDHIPHVNYIDGEKYTREEVVQDKKLLKLFKK